MSRRCPRGGQPDQQFLHRLVGNGQRIAERHGLIPPAAGRLGQVVRGELHPINAVAALFGLRGADQPCPQHGPGVGRRGCQGRFDRRRIGQPDGRATRLQPEQPSGGAVVSAREVGNAKSTWPNLRSSDASRRESAYLRNSARFVTHSTSPSRESSAPAWSATSTRVQRPVTGASPPTRGIGLHVQSSDGASGREGQHGARVAGHGTQSSWHVRQFQLGQHPSGRTLDRRQHGEQAAHLQRRGWLTEVGIPRDHMQPAEPGGIGQRLVAGVDQGTAASGHRRQLVMQHLGPLADREPVRGPASRAAEHCRVTRKGVRAAASVGRSRERSML